MMPEFRSRSAVGSAARHTASVFVVVASRSGCLATRAGSGAHQQTRRSIPFGRPLLATLIGLGWLMLAASACPAEERLTLKNGDRLTGYSQLSRPGWLKWQLTDGQSLEIPLELVESLEVLPEHDLIDPELPPSPPLPLTNPDDVFSHKATDPPIASPLPPLPPLPPLINSIQDVGASLTHEVGTQAVLWTRRISFGGQSNSGNTNTDLVDAVADFERGTATTVRQFDMGGQWARANNRITANRWWLNSNFDWPIRDKWITFVTSRNEYNEQAFLDYRGTVSTGIGYRFVYDDKKRLIVRVGPAFTVEDFSNVTGTRYTPDFFGELEVRWPLFQRMSLEHKIRVQPNMMNAQLVRVFSNTGILIDLDSKDRWKLRLGLRTEFISEPAQGRVPTDTFSTVSLVYQRK